MKLSDLEITLKAIDKTGKVFKNVEKGMGKLKVVSKTVSVGLAAIGTSAVGAFTAAVANGATFNDELTRMANSIGTTTKEADELYKIIREGAPLTNIENLGEGILTLKEGFFDARAESGPLFDLIKDFGADIDTSLERPREQLLAFLEAMRQIPSETVRAGAAVANFGGEDAKAIIKITNDTETLNKTIERLRGTVEDLPSFISDAQLENMKEAKESSNELDASWDNLSTTAYSLVAPALTFISSKLSDFIIWVDNGIKKAAEFLGIFDDAFSMPTTIEDANEQFRITTQRLKEVTAEAEKLRAASERGDVRLDMSADPFKDEEIKALKIHQVKIAAMKADFIAEQAARDEASAMAEAAKKQLALEESLEKQLETKRNAQQRERDALREEALENIALGHIKSLDSMQSTISEMNSTFRSAAIETLDFQASAANDSVHTLENSLLSLSSSFGTFANAAGESGSKAFKTFKTIEIALSTIAAVSAAIKAASAASSAGPFAAFAAYAAVFAKLIAGVAAIKSINLGSTSRPSISGGGGTTAPSITSQSTNPDNAINNQNNNQQQAPNITIQLSGAGRYSSDEIEELFSEMQRLGLVRDVRAA